MTGPEDLYGHDARLERALNQVAGRSADPRIGSSRGRTATTGTQLDIVSASTCHVRTGTTRQEQSSFAESVL